MKLNSLISLSIFFIAALPQLAMARPEYAVAEKTSCTACHISPFGGGHRNSFGKMYGSRKISKALTNEIKNFYGDFRAIYKRNEGNNVEGSTNTNGFALMSTEVSGYAEILKEDEGFSTSAVASFDFSSVQSGPRNAYILYTNADKKAPVYNILVGKTYIPFGIMTDDHRNYLRQQTNTSYNKDFEMGVSFSGTPILNIHYDLTLMNGYQRTSFNGGDETLGFNVNANWNPSDYPFMLGAGHVMHYSKARVNGPSPYATALYAIFDFREISDDKLPVSLLGEIDIANHFNTANNKNIGKFVNSTTHPAYSAAIADSTSRGLAGQIKWDISKQWQTSLRFEQLLLDKRYHGDAFNRTELMGTYYFTGNSSLAAAFDKATAKKPGINQDGNLYADTDSFFLLFRTWL